MAEEILLTKEGYDKLNAELNELKTKGRDDIAEKIKVALSYGDLSENSEYDEAKNEQAKVEGRIRELEEMLKNVIVIDETAANSNRVTLGKAVKVKNELTGKEIVYNIVGPTETDPFAHRISDQSPIGSALLNSVVGDTVTADTPKGAVKLTVLDITKA